MSAKNGMRPVHPGEILRDELEELGLSANAMAQALDVPANRVSAILKGQRGITADTALRLSRFFARCTQLVCVSHWARPCKKNRTTSTVFDETHFAITREHHDRPTMP